MRHGSAARPESSGSRYGFWLSSTGILRAIVGAAILVAACAIVPASSALAHPHVWVTVETTVEFEKGTIIGLRHTWTFDELYTAMAIEGLDKNNDGIYSREELAELAKVNIESLKEFDYFTAVRLASQALKVGVPTQYWLEHVDAVPVPGVTGALTPGKGKEADKKGTMDRFWNWMAGGPSSEGADGKSPPAKVLALHFFLPLEQPVLAEAEGFTFEVSDSSFFIALTPARAEPVKIGKGAPAGCRATLNSATTDDGRRLGDGNAAVPEGGLTFVNPHTISVSCKG